MRVKNFIFVVLGWREFISCFNAADLPANTVVFDKVKLGQLFGPSFADFIDIQLIDEPQVIANSKFKKMINLG